MYNKEEEFSQNLRIGLLGHRRTGARFSENFSLSLSHHPAWHETCNGTWQLTLSQDPDSTFKFLTNFDLKTQTKKQSRYTAAQAILCKIETCGPFVAGRKLEKFCICIKLRTRAGLKTNKNRAAEPWQRGGALQDMTTEKPPFVMFQKERNKQLCCQFYAQKAGYTLNE